MYGSWIWSYVVVAAAAGVLGFLMALLISKKRNKSRQAHTGAPPAAERIGPAAENQIVSSEERMREAIEAAGLGTIITEFGETSSKSIDWSAKAKELFGLPIAEPVDDTKIFASVHPSDYTQVNEAIESALRPDGDGLFRVEHRVIWPDRSIHWIAAYGRTTFTLRDGVRVPQRNVGIVRDVTGRRDAEEHLFSINQRLQSLMDAAPVGISFSTDASCKKITGNAAVLAQFRAKSADNLSASAPTEEAHGRKIRYFANGHELSDDALPLQRAVAENRILEPTELEILMPDGRRWFAEASAAPFHDAQGQVIGGLAVTVDITKRKLAEAALLEADRRKDEFLAILSHELRNPLAPIRSAAYMLKRDDIDKTQRNWCADVIDRQVSVMSRLLEDLLDISRIRHGRFELRKEIVPLQHIVTLALESSRPAIEASRHEIDVKLPDEAFWLDADPVRLAQVFSNLLNNAAKYTPDGGRISLGIRADAAHVWVSVQDNGIGIEPDWQPQLFEMFTRAAGIASQSMAGLGIGLSLVRTIVDMHGGTIEAKSEGLGKGSVFEVRLPRHAHRENALAARTHRSLEKIGNSSARVVVIVDDNRYTADCLAAALAMVGHKVQAVYGGREAIAAAEALRPDVMLIDIGMPDMDGYAVCREIRAQREGDRIRLVAVTGWGRKEDRERTEAAGFDLHLVKPVHPDEIVEILALAADVSPSSLP
jgi:PAS domain S-box-containing protein